MAKRRKSAGAHASRTSLARVTRVEQHILHVRGQKVLLDSDLAPMYGVETNALTRAVRRNADRFPPDFMLRLTGEEFAPL